MGKRCLVESPNPMAASAPLEVGADEFKHVSPGTFSRQVEDSNHELERQLYLLCAGGVDTVDLGVRQLFAEKMCLLDRNVRFSI